MDINVEIVPTQDGENAEMIKGAIKKILGNEVFSAQDSKPTTFETIYTILEILEKHLDDDFNSDVDLVERDLSETDLGISERKLKSILKLMTDGGLIDRGGFTSYSTAITLKGLEFLAERKYQ